MRKKKEEEKAGGREVGEKGRRPSRGSDFGTILALFRKERLFPKWREAKSEKRKRQGKKAKEKKK